MGWVYRGAVLGSLVFFLATATLGVRSYFTMDAWNVREGPTAGSLYWVDWTVRTAKGRVWYGWQRNGGFATLILEAHGAGFVGWHSYRMQPQALQITAPMTGGEWAGFEYSVFRDMRGGVPQVAVAAPLWAILVVAAVLPAMWVWGRRRRRYAAGMCQGCGYDLRASPVRCPECGRAVGNVER